MAFLLLALAGCNLNLAIKRAHSMSESKIQPLRPFILRMRYVIFLLLQRQIIPHRVLLLIPTNIVKLDSIEEHDVKRADRQQNLVSSTVCYLSAHGSRID